MLSFTWRTTLRLIEIAVWSIVAYGAYLTIWPGIFQFFQGYHS